MPKVSLYFILFLSFLNSYSQDKNQKHSVSDYNEGFYMTLEDLIAKKPTPLEAISRLDVKSFKPVPDNQIVDQTFFVTLKDNSKLKKVFAVSYQGNLYIRQAYFTKYASKGDRVDAASNPQSYHRVIMDGNFFYMECVFANTWKTSVGYNMGIAGSAIASSAYQLKPIIFNFETKKFDLFRNCEDLNAFLSSRNSPLKAECDKRYLSLDKMKEFLAEEIKK